MKSFKNIRILLGFLAILIMTTSCFQGRPSEDPPIHLNPNMDNQPRYEAQESSKFFKDGAVMRQPVDGTIARGQIINNPQLNNGKNADGSYVMNNPLTVDMQILKRGRNRYDIYCAPCHGRAGDGKSIVVNRGYLPPPTFHQDMIRNYPDGQIFDVITNGIRNMPSYKHMIPVKDRWAIVSYVRALQRSQNADLSDIPVEKRDEIN